MTQPTTERIIAVFFLALPTGVVILGLVLVYFGSWRVRYAWQSLTWSTTTGEVTVSEVEQWTERRKGAFDEPRTFYRAKLRYQYDVDGQTLEHQRVRIGETGVDSRAAAERRLAPYPKGQRVTVYFDPTKPGDAALENGPTSTAYWLLLGGLVTTALAVRLWLSWLREFGVTGSSSSVEASTDSTTDAA